jgi:hypothetical protein
LRQNTTPGDREPRELSPSQARALTSLAEGATVSTAARAAGVDRTTVHRWLRHDYAFQAAHNASRRELRHELGVQLEQAVQASLKTVLAAIDGGDVRAALTVLKGSGVLAQESIGSENPAELEEEAELTERERTSRRKERRLFAAF